MRKMKNPNPDDSLSLSFDFRTPEQPNRKNLLDCMEENDYRMQANMKQRPQQRWEEPPLQPINLYQTKFKDQVVSQTPSDPWGDISCIEQSNGRQEWGKSWHQAAKNNIDVDTHIVHGLVPPSVWYRTRTASGETQITPARMIRRPLLRVFIG